MSNTSKFVSVVIVLALIAIGINFTYNHEISRSPVSATSTLRTVSVGIQASPAMALIMVAKDKGFFTENGLNVDLQQFSAGKLAMQAFLGGSLDFAISGDVPAALAAMQGNQFVVPAQVVKSTTNEVRIVARQDGAITDPETYFTAKKRNLGTSIGGGPEFFTYQFLRAYGITDNQIKIVSENPADMVAALESKGVDAISIFDPVAYKAEKSLGTSSVTFTNKDIYSELYVIDAKESVKKNPEVLNKFLTGLIEAQNYTNQNPEDAKAIVMNYTKLDKATIDGIWGNYDFTISLTPKLLQYWNEEQVWAKDTGKVSKDATSIDFSSYIYSDSLRELSPSNVGL